MNGFVVFSSLGRLEKLLEWVLVYICILNYWRSMEKAMFRNYYYLLNLSLPKVGVITYHHFLLMNMPLFGFKRKRLPGNLRKTVAITLLAKLPILCVTIVYNYF